jgi:hypothetical protein
MLFNKTRDKKDEGDFSDRRDKNKKGCNTPIGMFEK